MTHKLRALLPLALVTLAACPPKAIRVPTTPDPTPPGTILLSVEPPGQEAVSPIAGPVTVTVGANDQVKLSAAGWDQDGGAKDIQLWTTTTTWRDNPNGTTVQTGPGLAGRPTASNPSTAQPGDVTDDVRRVTHTLDIGAARGSANRVRVEVWAEVHNFYAGTLRSNVVTLQNF